MIEILILLLTFLLGWATPVRMDTPPSGVVPTPVPLPTIAPVGDEPTFQSMTVIEHVDALMLESYPVQISLVVKGYQPDGCDYPVVVSQTRSGNQVNVQIYRTMPLAAMCPAMILPYEAAVPLDGGFETGTYTIDVNGYVITVTV